mmetsp:Transcript_19665/g.45883  ORF Transcript_19665/g.45883 Transcript_19665/m.45883 type:complete len:155 (-) Transcript_19665:25-489(-)
MGSLQDARAGNRRDPQGTLRGPRARKRLVLRKRRGPIAVPLHEEPRSARVRRRQPVPVKAIEIESERKEKKTRTEDENDDENDARGRLDGGCVGDRRSDRVRGPSPSNRNDKRFGVSQRSVKRRYSIRQFRSTSISATKIKHHFGLKFWKVHTK